MRSGAHSSVLRPVESRNFEIEHDIDGCCGQLGFCLTSLIPRFIPRRKIPLYSFEAICQQSKLLCICDTDKFRGSITQRNSYFQSWIKQSWANAMCRTQKQASFTTVSVSCFSSSNAVSSAVIISSMLLPNFELSRYLLRGELILWNSKKISSSLLKFLDYCYD